MSSDIFVEIGSLLLIDKNSLTKENIEYLKRITNEEDIIINIWNKQYKINPEETPYIMNFLDLTEELDRDYVKALSTYTDLKKPKSLKELIVAANIVMGQNFIYMPVSEKELGEFLIDNEIFNVENTNQELIELLDMEKVAQKYLSENNSAYYFKNTFIDDFEEKTLAEIAESLILNTQAYYRFKNCFIILQGINNGKKTILELPVEDEKLLNNFNNFKIDKLFIKYNELKCLFRDENPNLKVLNNICKQLNVLDIDEIIKLESIISVHLDSLNEKNYEALKNNSIFGNKNYYICKDLNSIKMLFSEVIKSLDKYLVDQKRDSIYENYFKIINPDIYKQFDKYIDYYNYVVDKEDKKELYKFYSKNNHYVICTDVKSFDNLQDEYLENFQTNNMNLNL